MRLEGKRAFVTGAASGFGRAIALQMAKEGADVVVGDLSEAGAEETAQLIREAGGDGRAVVCDVAEPDAFSTALDVAADALGGLDILVNNAGVAQFRTPVEATDLTAFDRVFAVNVKSILIGAMAATPHLQRSGRGVILNTVSTAALRPRPQLAIYNASKGAALILSKTLALELAPKGIRVNAICPGGGDTPMLANFLGGNSEEAREAFLRSVPMGRFCEPNDVAAAMVFLASDEASFITGVALEVDGGRCV